MDLKVGLFSGAPAPAESGNGEINISISYCYSLFGQRTLSVCVDVHAHVNKNLLCPIMCIHVFPPVCDAFKHKLMRKNLQNHYY